MTTKPVTFLILGAGGDLTQRLLLPGLGSLLAVEPDREVQVIGADRAELDDTSFRTLVSDRLKRGGADASTARKVAGKASYIKADLLDPVALEGLVGAAAGELVIYFALPPAISMKVCAELEKLTLPPSTRLGLEKPFGSDEKSARSFNKQLQRVVPEEQIFRVDHFLGVSTVLNLIGLRFANRMLQPIWNAEHIERVEIIYDEDLALEGRAGYYDKAGALRDMLQSHLLQILAVFAMEPIADLEPQELADLKAQVLRATRIWEDDPATYARRARYTAGSINGREVPSYAKEEGVESARSTETLAQLTVEIKNNRWSGVPFVLRSGKALGVPRKQIIVYFRAVPHLPKGFHGDHAADAMVIDLKPGRVSLQLSMNAEGDPLDLERKSLVAELAAARMTAYGEVLRCMLDDDQLLSVRSDAAELCWKIVAPAIRAFESGKVPLQQYKAGSDGPKGWLSADSMAVRQQEESAVSQAASEQRSKTSAARPAKKTHAKKATGKK
ncbi:glucose-6-phosphate dehydrogenase [Yimella sp. cx-573]|nr:glucose-6-phosphate dehydrogenase [Yimella sp. cx-573]